MPEGASTPEAFASGCWYCPGSTLFVRREEFDAVGPFDESLRRLEDLDWALRFSLIGGRLACVPVTGAAIRPSRSQGLATVEAAAARLKAKFGSDGANALPPGAYRRLLAYLDVELAAVHRNEGRPGMTAVHLLRSLLRVPRLTVPLGRHWHPGPPPRAAEEAAYAALEADTD